MNTAAVHLLVIIFIKGRHDSPNCCEQGWFVLVALPLNMKLFPDTQVKFCLPPPPSSPCDALVASQHGSWAGVTQSQKLRVDNFWRTNVCDQILLLFHSYNAICVNDIPRCICILHRNGIVASMHK